MARSQHGAFVCPCLLALGEPKVDADTAGRASRGTRQEGQLGPLAMPFDRIKYENCFAT
jgi:hypothetical protein